MRRIGRRRVAFLAGAILALMPLMAGCGAPPSSGVTITIEYSRFEPSSVSIPAGVPVTVHLVNLDPIDHEWIVGDAALHDRHRTGTEPVHGERPTEISVPALETVTTVVTFEEGSYQMICHVPGHEAYGMAGEVRAG